jgi:hypothetical protein
MPESSTTDGARAAMWDMIIAYRTSQIVRTVATLSLAEHCADGPVTAEAVAAAESADPAAVARLLRASAALGLVTTADEINFSGTNLLDILRRDADGSQWGFAMSLPAPGHWLPWGDLPEAVRTGGSRASASLGQDIFQYYGTHPEEAAPFFAGLNGMTAVAGAAAAQLIDTSDARMAVDVGGASGSLLHDLMAVNPKLTGIVMDVPEVAERATQAAEDLGLHDRLQAVGGDFFESIPTGGDIYLLRYVLHDWDDDSCVRILTRCREAMKPTAKLYVLELVLGPIGREDKVVPLQDMNMLAILYGKERKTDEFGALLEAAGLRLSAVIPTDSPMTIIEAVPA